MPIELGRSRGRFQGFLGQRSGGKLPNTDNFHPAQQSMHSNTNLFLVNWGAADLDVLFIVGLLPALEDAQGPLLSRRPCLSGCSMGCYLRLRTTAGRRTDFGAFPMRTRPKSGPEARFQARKHYCVT